MNNKLTVIIALIVLPLFFTSCATMQTSTNIKSKYGTAKHIDVEGSGILCKPVIADLEVKPTKVTASAEGDNTTVSKLKKAAIFNAVEKSSADIIVEPIYVVERDNDHLKVTVKGYPAFYKNFRTIKKEDIELLEVGNSINITTENAGQTHSTTTTVKKKKGLFGLGKFGL